MPILHLQISVEATGKDGAKRISPNRAMVQYGPRLQVTLGLADSVTKELQQQGKPIPQPISGIALIDTGATVTCIDDGTAQQIGLPVIDYGMMASASHDATRQNIYPARIEISGPGIAFNVNRAMGANLMVQGLMVLLGRDVLANSIFIYNGLTGEITWSR